MKIDLNFTTEQESSEILKKIFDQITTQDYLDILPIELIHNYLEQKYHNKLIVNSPEIVDFKNLSTESIYKLIIELIEKGTISLEMIIGQVTLKKIMFETKNNIKIQN